MTPRSFPLIKRVELLVLVSSLGTLAHIRAHSISASEPVASAALFPTFDRVLLLETTSETSANVSIGDLNCDGFLDIVLAKGPVTGR